MKFDLDKFNKEPLASVVLRHLQQYPQSTEVIAIIGKSKALAKQVFSSATGVTTIKSLQTDFLHDGLFQNPVYTMLRQCSLIFKQRIFHVFWC